MDPKEENNIHQWMERPLKMHNFKERDKKKSSIGIFFLNENDKQGIELECEYVSPWTYERECFFGEKMGEEPLTVDVRNEKVHRIYDMLYGIKLTCTFFLVFLV